jgi:hypothetical protein
MLTVGLDSWPVTVSHKLTYCYLSAFGFSSCPLRDFRFSVCRLADTRIVRNARVGPATSRHLTHPVRETANGGSPGSGDHGPVSQLRRAPRRLQWSPAFIGSHTSREKIVYCPWASASYNQGRVVHPQDGSTSEWRNPGAIRTERSYDMATSHSCLAWTVRHGSNVHIFYNADLV